MRTRGESEIGHCVEYTSKTVAEQSKSSSGSYVGASAAKRGWTLDESQRSFYRLAEKGELPEVVQTSRISNSAFSDEQQKLSNELVNPSLGLLAGQAMNQSHFGGDGSLRLIIETCLSLVFNVQAKQTSATTLIFSALQAS
jgi:hypothetical protein